MTFTDKYLRTTSVHFMCTLHDQEVRWHVLDKVREFEASVVGEAGQRIETVPTDNVAEYVNQDFPNYLESRQINHETSVPFTPQHNELAERVTAPLSRKQGPLKQVWPNHTRSMQYQRLPTCRSWTVHQLERTSLHYLPTCVLPDMSSRSDVILKDRRAMMSRWSSTNQL